jgi:hypothetical protein
MTTVFQIEVTDDDAHNRGWLAFLLAQDRPDPIEDVEAAAGWDLAQRQNLGTVRNIFQPGREAQPYTVTVGEPEEDEPAPPVAVAKKASGNE